MKTHTTSEAIAILEREPEAMFEAPKIGYYSVAERVARHPERDHLAVVFEFHNGGKWKHSRTNEIVLRSDWVRTDKEES